MGGLRFPLHFVFFVAFCSNQPVNEKLRDFVVRGIRGRQRLHKQPSMYRSFAASRLMNLSCRTEATSAGVVFRRQTLGESITPSSGALGYNPREP